MKSTLIGGASASILLFFVSSATSQRVVDVEPNKLIRKSTLADEATAQLLWQRICHRGAREEAKNGDNYVYCALVPNHDTPITVNHPPIHLDHTRASTKGNQIVIIDPPYYTYNHKFVLQGDRASPQRTIIYVRPPKHRHEAELKDETTAEGKPRKPQIIYLDPAKEQDAEPSGTEPPHDDTHPSATAPEPQVENAPEPEVEDSPKEEATNIAPVVDAAPLEEAADIKEVDKSSVRAARAPIPLPIPLPYARANPGPEPLVQSNYAPASSTVFFQLGAGAEMKYTIEY